MAVSYSLRKLGLRIVCTLGLLALPGCTGGCAVQMEDGQAARMTASRDYTISWTLHQNLPVPEDAEMVRDVEERFNVNLDIWNLENNRYEALLDMKLAQGQVPDLFRIRQPQDILKYQRQGLLAEIPEELLNEYAPNIMKAIRDHAPGYLEYGRIDGKYYGIPVINPTNIYRIPVVYRQDWLDRLGLTVPQTLSELEQVLYGFAHDDPDGNGKNDTYGLSREGMNIVFGAYGQIVFADALYFGVKGDRLVIGALEPEMKEALRYLRKWYQDGVIDPEFATGENKGGYKHLSHAFINGRIGMSSMGNYYHWIQEGAYVTWRMSEDGKTMEQQPIAASYNVRELTAKNSLARIVFGQPVSGPGGQRGSKAYDQLMSFTAIGRQVASEPGKLERMLEILDAVSASPDPDENMSMRLGIQGKHWQWADSSKQQALVLPPYDRMFSYQNTIGANLGMTVPVMPTDPREQWASTLGLEHDGIYNALEVATPMLAERGTELIRLRNKAYIAIITGEQPLDGFDAFVQEFLAAGGSEVLEEANEWYRQHHSAG